MNGEHSQADPEHSERRGSSLQLSRQYRSKKNQPSDIVIAVVGGGLAAFVKLTKPVVLYAASGEPRTKTKAPREFSLRPVSSIHAPPPSIEPEDITQTSTIFKSRTCLYGGPSSDQDPHLLRHLAFDSTNRFGDANWMVWRMLPRAQDPVFFTVIPNAHLDAHEDIYDTKWLDSIVSPFQDVVIDAYYRHVHPTFPILEPQQLLKQAISEQRVPASLLGAIYTIALPFLDNLGQFTSGKKPDVYALYFYVTTALGYETMTPSLRTVQANVIILQTPPVIIREPNLPGAWTRTSSLLALGQEIGLHLDPTGWNIDRQEQKSRKIAWWIIYVQEKWLSHWLGYPSHILAHSWTVPPLAIGDFSDEKDTITFDMISSANKFIALTELTLILGDVLSSFYTQRPARPNANQILLEDERRILHQLDEWKVRNRWSVTNPHKLPNEYFIVFAYSTIHLSVCRAVHAKTEFPIEATKERAMTVFDDLIHVLSNLQPQAVDMLWLSYCKGCLTFMGNFMITVMLSSVEDRSFESGKRRLDEYMALLERISKTFEFSKLPCQRLNLIIQRLFSSRE
ncbi:hypothetical protein GLAREA_04200 [Glarea lozoyensis ATCC 20868]|uniref:Xylanolytic transcriptional activator regulatory domain-containing protein n=1 Tax=Glarea lozoyensis (strain ATCC 20868 / MF5171) TaxID=1116229 RepID=S3CQM1_GLAL2|nr:uncharacterized protein GLAREA_04200 [Glarea lozoyensis ATCC 20868]EPE27409.1 hypothetical protein GLAREA_04200 [Glarea lozoyensis ATCC 20868]